MSRCSFSVPHSRFSVLHFCPRGAIFALIGLLFLSGCGKQPNRFHVSGTVTFQGQPVPAGTIIFDPDLSANNDGAQGIAEIEDGSYDTRRTREGCAGGAMIARIDGFDGESTDELPYGKPLFTTYQMKVELPRADTMRNFDVPASAASTLPSQTGPLP